MERNVRTVEVVTRGTTSIFVIGYAATVENIFEKEMISNENKSMVIQEK